MWLLTFENIKIFEMSTLENAKCFVPLSCIVKYLIDESQLRSGSQKPSTMTLCIYYSNNISNFHIKSAFIWQSMLQPRVFRYQYTAWSKLLAFWTWMDGNYIWDIEFSHWSLHLLESPLANFTYAIISYHIVVLISIRSSGCHFIHSQQNFKYAISQC